ncbi:protein-L-isoaspartate O-methyltransferase family protein [Candidatus Magnetaquicoccus inordinatus]|uniref:protein-L-isoaspartate O-methyltransferase family protein n=1 Tax=Candidatus Magnetaquicoccus inordinatus TaxID=2496818 RepID=UPI00102BE774|nr:protein-L-isoaspartate O-methyltransferase [Candidatus Magnetaquicoccus inordinatus]
MDFALARTNMVKSQVVPNNISHHGVLDAMQSTPREPFVLPSHQMFAYSDFALPMGAVRRSLKPLQIARLLDALEITPGQKILVVGAGTGYEATLAARLGAQVYALESDAQLVAIGQTVENTQLSWHTAPLVGGWPEQAPFDGILLCGAVPAIPDALLAQRKPLGALVAIQGNEGDAVMYMVRMRGSKKEILGETVAFPLLAGEQNQPFVI